MTARWTYYLCAMDVLVVIAFGAAQQLVGPTPRPFASGLTQPLLVAELECGGRERASFLTGDETAHVAATLPFDEKFLLAYGTLFVLCGGLLWQRRLRVLGSCLAVAGVVGAWLDHCENAAMRRVLVGAIDCSHPWSMWKWGLLFAAMIGLAAVFLDRRSSTASTLLGLVAALASAMAGVEGLVGVLRPSPVLIEGAALRLPVALVAGFVFLSTHHLLRDGVGGWLERVARWTVAGRAPFGQLARWPRSSLED